MPIWVYDCAMARAATTSDVFNAIAEQQRREILVLLRAGERPVTELAQELGMTQPGASKHLRVLREVGLVRDLSRWWGPEGFTTTTRAFEFHVGGEWDFVMHGPDGTDYQEWISWTEIAPPERIALLHGESRGDPNAFKSVLTFAPDGAATRIEMRTVFPTKELRDEAVEKYHAIEGGQQTLSNLVAYVTEIVRKGAEG